MVALVNTPSGLTYAAATELPPSTTRHAYLLGNIYATTCGIDLTTLILNPSDMQWPGDGPLCPTCLERTS